MGKFLRWIGNECSVGKREVLTKKTMYLGNYRVRDQQWSGGAGKLCE